MSSEVYNNNSYYYEGNQPNEYRQKNGQSWNNWNSNSNSNSNSNLNSNSRYVQSYSNNEQQNYDAGNNSNYPSYHSNTVNHYNRTPSRNNHLRYNRYPTRVPRGYFRNRYPNVNNQYMGTPGPSHGWQRGTQHYKRTRPDNGDGEQTAKTTKKKKKPLSQNVPNKKDWTAEDAEIALSTEKVFNKKSKNALIIKFPDHELSKEIVSQLHPSIENVHFQQPCTPRFCFVTLKESVDPDEIITALNKQKFGEGYLTVEYKKDRDEEQVVLADDIDPLTLYVGNLAQEVTKDDIVNLYPNNKRIDIGFAKKMKFTRYAFIGFRTAAESLEAFKRTHCKQMYSKSLIVRFRRLHGTIGMPGEAKPQNPPRTREEVAEGSTVTTTNGTLDQPLGTPQSEATSEDTDTITTIMNSIVQCLPVNLHSLKRETPSTVYSDDESEYKTAFCGEKPSFEDIFVGESQWNHKPKLKTEPNIHIKTEQGVAKQVKTEEMEGAVKVKSEPKEIDDEVDISSQYHHNNDDDGDETNDNEDEDDTFSDMMDFNRIYENMVLHKQKLSSLKKD